MNTTKPVISEETARMAADVLRGIMQGTLDADDRDINQRRLASEALIRLYFTQVKFGLEDLDRLAQSPKASRDVRNLADLTPVSLEELRERMTADFPGKKLKPS